MKQAWFAVGIVLLFLFSSVTSVGIGYITNLARTSPSEKAMDLVVMNRYNIHRYPEGYSNPSSVDVQSNLIPSIQNQQMTGSIPSISSNGGPMDSPWPMYSHDVHHTGQSPYSTSDNPLVEIWRFGLDWDTFYAGFILDSDGMIYGGPEHIYGIYPNGTMKWSYNPGRPIESTPAIDENGVLYFGTIWGQPNYLHAIYSSNGTQKWAYYVGNDIDSSPAIGLDGTIYFGDWAGYVNAINPDGTLKWKYHTDSGVITSSPAIGDDGTIYIGSFDNYLYAFYPNGTVKWRFQTGAWIHASPTIGADGTVYIGSDDSYLYALNPEDGSLIWRCHVGGGTWCSPTIGTDGTLYLGTYDMRFQAINPNGTIIWTYNAPGRIWFGSSATISSDGTIYFGTTTQDGGSGALIALNSDGTERFRDTHGFYATTPAIGEDGTVYAPSFNYASMNGQLHAFGRGPLHVDTGGPYSGLVNTTISFSGTIYGGIPPYTVLWDFGDGNHSNKLNPYHTYTLVGNYTVILTVNDSEGNFSNDTTTVNITYPFPSVRITKPGTGIYLMNKRILPFYKSVVIGRITIEVTATQVPLGIDRVEFYVGDTLKATDTTAPYSWTWTGLHSYGTYYVRAFAYDTSQRRSIATIYILRII
jgi:outer membrane protein assembly factor BamB